MLRKTSFFFCYYSNSNSNNKATTATGNQRNTLGGDKGGAADYFTFSSRSTIDLARQSGQGRGISPTNEYYSNQPENSNNSNNNRKKGQQTIEELHDVLNSFRTKPRTVHYQQNREENVNIAGELEATKPSFLQQMKTKTSSVSNFLARTARGKKVVECWCGHRFETEIWKDWLVCPMSYCEAPACPNQDFFISGEGKMMVEEGRLQSGSVMKTVAGSIAENTKDRKK